MNDKVPGDGTVGGRAQRASSWRYHEHLDAREVTHEEGVVGTSELRFIANPVSFDV